MKIFGWFKNDLKDLDGTESSSGKEVDSLVKKYTSKSGESANAIKKKMVDEVEKQKKKRKENKDLKEKFGSTTSDDISKNRKKKLWRYLWIFLAITLLIIIAQAIYQVSTSGITNPIPVQNKQKILDGIEEEDTDYFESKISSQVSALAAQMKKMKNEGEEKESAAKEALVEEAKKNEALQKKINDLQSRLDAKDQNGTGLDIAGIVEEQLGKIKKQISDLTDRPSPGAMSHSIQPLPSSGDDVIVENDVLVKPTKKETPSLPKEERKMQKQVKHAVKAIREEYEYSDITIEVLPVDKNIGDHTLAKDKEKPLPSLHIMTGFSRAILITGVDAPTFGAGKSNPVPVVLSVTSEQVVANGFDANIEDCMLIGQAFGNMNTMRAEIEVTRISCNVEKNGVMHKIEESVKAWVYGENGIHGVKGRLVDSAGKILTKEIAVGFLQGVATAFAQPQTSIQTVGGVPSQIFESGNINDATQTGLGQGAANGLTSLSDYYTKLLDGAYPFVSVRSGRNVTVLFKGGENIKMTPYTRVDVDGDHKPFGEDESTEIDIDEW